MRTIWTLLLSLASLAARPAAADVTVPSDPAAGDPALEFSGEYRLQGTALSDFAVDADGHRMDQPWVGDQRLRAAVHFRAKRFRIGTEWDLMSGQLFGDPWGVPCVIDERRRHELSVTSARSFVPRRAAASLTWPALTLELGLISSHWGLGLVANDGAHDPLFGRADFGDRLVRLRATVKPGHAEADNPSRDVFLLTLAGDWVIADDTARFAERQLAFHGIFSALYADAAARRLGLYLVFREQRELDEGRFTRALVVDGYGQLPVAFGDGGWGGKLAAEGALIVGRTDRATTYGSPEAVDVLSGGAAGVLTVHAPEQRFQLHLRGGIASGDPDPDDGTSRDFTFDRDFDVGMVLFDQVLGGTDAATHALLSDPTRSPPPDGAEALVTEGAFRRAAYLQPVVQITPVAWADLRFGVLLAGSVIDHAQPYYTFRAGGTARNAWDSAPEGRHLGTELDWAVRIGGTTAPARPQAPHAHLVVQGGHLIAGPALAGGPDTVHQLMVTGRLRW